MKNNFFKYILLSSGSKQNRTELETETLPYTFNSNSYKLRNYRIYGNTVDGESVGDLVTEGEHAGEYCVPVTITNGTESKTNNIYLLEQIRKVGDHAEYIDYGEQKQHRVRKNLFDFNAFVSSITETASGGTTSVQGQSITLTASETDYYTYPYLGDQSGVYKIPVLPNAKYILSWEVDNNKNGRIYVFLNGSLSGAQTVFQTEKSIKFATQDDTTYVTIRFGVYSAGDSITYSNIQLSKGSTVLPYEPYIENTDLDVTLPALPTLKGTNVLSVGTEVQPSKIYIKGNISTFDVSNWANVQKLVRAGLHDKYFKIGDQLVCQKGGSDLTWDIIGFDHDTPTDSQFTHSMTLQLHDCLPSAMLFDAPEALYYAENGLVAGTYNFTIQSGYDTAYGGGKTYQFTLENDVPAGGQLTFGWSNNTQAADAKVSSYSSSTSTTAIEQVAVTEGSAGTNLGTTDGNSTNVNHINRVRYGSNNYGESAIIQFLNSSANAGSVWTPQTKYDRPPSWNASTAGFMKDIDSDFLAVLGASPKVVALNTVTDGGGSVTINNDKFFLLSRSEVYGGKENNINEGEPYPYYSNYSDLPAAGVDDDSNRIKYRSGTAQVWWLRSPYSANGTSVRYVTTGGIVSYFSFASDSSGVAPACNII